MIKLGTTDIGTAKLGATQVRKIMLGSTKVWATYPQEVLDDSPVAYWRLGETSGTTAEDEIGSYDGTFVGGPTLGVTGAVAGDTATSLVSAGQRVDSSFGMTFDASVTVEAWVYPRAVEDLVRYIFVCHNSGNTAFAGPLLLLAGSSLTGAPNNAIRFQIGQTPGTYRTTTTALAAGAWSHIVATYASGGLATPTTSIKIYINGIEASYFDSQNTGTTGQTYNGSIGGRRYDASRQFYGGLDEVAIYNYALSQARAIAHYNARNNQS